MILQADPLRRLTGEIFVACGCSAEEGARIAHYLVEANLTGHDSHGVIRVPRYVNQVREGGVVPNREITIVTENEVMAVVDGNFGFGQTIGPQAVRLGIDKAAKQGVAIIALRSSGHLGRIGDWAEMAAAAGQISIHFVNVSGSLLVAPFGGTGRRMATNPVAIGVPVADGPTLIHDFATSVVAEGKVLVAATGGKPVPPGSLIDADGTLSNDPKVLYGSADPTRSSDMRNGSGALRAMGEHKGSGLSLMCELLAGALTGSGCAGPDKQHVVNGMLSIYMAVEFFNADGSVAAELRQSLDFFKSAKPAKPDGEILLTGEPESRLRATRLAEGIPLPEATWQAILGAARSVETKPQAIEAVLG